MVYRKRVCGDKESETVTYFISSLKPRVKLLAKHVKDHWRIENELHWSLDVTFREDASRIRKNNGQASMAMFRRMAMNILRRDRSKASLKIKRKQAGWSPEFIEELLTYK